MFYAMNGSPSELGDGRMSGTLFLVWRGWVHRVLQGLVGLVESTYIVTVVGIAKDKRLLYV